MSVLEEQKRWYVINVYSGFERKAVQAILEQAEKKGLTDYIDELLVPSEDVIEVRRGKKVSKERQYFPGYILAKIHLNDEIWHLIKSVPRVASFLGAKGRPQPISEKEVERILVQVKEAQEHPRHGVTYEIGEQVRVIDGPFNSFTGQVEDVDDEKERLSVSVTIFGRATPVELEFTQVEKI